MGKETEIILEMFDIRRLKSRCNFPDCEKKPFFEAVIYQRSVRKGKKTLASLYVCKNHIKDVEELLSKLRMISPKTMTECMTNEIRKGR